MSWEKVQISHKNNPPELQSFHFTWHVALPDPSDTLGMLWHLGGPGGCVIQCDSWRQEDRQGLGPGIRKGELCLWNSELSTSLSSSPKCYPYCPGKGDITTKEAALRDQLDPPKQAASCLLNFSATDKTASVSALHFRPLNSLSATPHKPWPALWPARLSAVLCICDFSCGSVHFPPQPFFSPWHMHTPGCAGVLSKSEQWEALNRAQARPQSIFTSVWSHCSKAPSKQNSTVGSP